MRCFLTLLILSSVIVAGFPGDARAQRGKNAFTTVFREAATGRSDGNAYLLAYLSTLIYPEMLDQVSGPKGSRENEVDYVRRLHGNPRFFQDEYAKATAHLFYDPAGPAAAANVVPQYRFVNATNQGGYDPEAMVISTPKAVLVVFRGTDRVASARTDIGYGALEWLHTDFYLLGLRPDPPEFNLPGKVHAGFWESLKARTSRGIEFREDLFQQIVAFGGRNKRVWITGHSLGAAHAQWEARNSDPSQVWIVEKAR